MDKGAFKKLFKITLGFLLVTLNMLFITSCTFDNGPVIISSANDTPSFIQDIQPIFDNNCIGCHDDEHSTGLDLRMGFSYSLLVNINSTGYSPFLRFKPNSADSSVLWNKVAGTRINGMQMPPGGPYLQTFEIDNIKNWIYQGAQNN